MQFPHPDAAESVPLKDSILAEIDARGSIPFADFMRLALYHPTYGYYFVQDPSRDYQSSPNVHPIFGAMLGRQLAELWRLLGQPQRFDTFEAGAGSGRLAANIIDYLEHDEPALARTIRYVVQDLTYQRNDATDAAPDDQLARVTDLPATPEIEGCIISNELLDALPFHRVRRRGGRLLEVQVGYGDGRFIDVEVAAGPAIEAYFRGLGIQPGEGCDAEVCLEASDWMARAARALRRGYILTLDYGYPAASLYAPWRKAGTLLTFYHHMSGEDPYARPGLQDITASVDLTSATLAGESAGLRTLGLTSQTQFLAALGIGEAVAKGPAGGDLEAYYALRRSVIELTDPSGLGRVSVLVQGKGVTNTLPTGLST
jgi:SAM-dependent MidA family methyltransferase